MLVAVDISALAFYTDLNPLGLECTHAYSEIQAVAVSQPGAPYLEEMWEIAATYLP
jgi:hypothetical protein